jgi:hypothetical protein
MIGSLLPSIFHHTGHPSVSGAGHFAPHPSLDLTEGCRRTGAAPSSWRCLVVLVTLS